MVEILLKDKKYPIHIIGGGGVGMSGLAALLFRLGFEVSASDQNNSDYLKLIEKQGVRTWIGSQPQNIKENSVTFYSTAIPKDDKERSFVDQQNWPSFRRHPLLQFITKQFFTIAICGTHGKTTTSAWLAYTFLKNNKKINALIGGKLKDYKTNFFFGDYCFEGKPVLVIEADESDESFEYIDANITAITNVELDHPDHFSDISQIEKCFFQIIETTKKNRGKIFLSQQVSQDFSQKTQLDILSYKTNSEKNILEFDKCKYLVNLNGEHNLHNSSIVASITSYCGLTTNETSIGLETFTGVSRRMDLLLDKKVDNCDIKLIDDYAHHPTEIEAVFSVLAREEKSIICLWEPHRISRFLHFLNGFLGVFSKYSDKNIEFYMLPIFTAGEKEKDFIELAKAKEKVENYGITLFVTKEEHSSWLQNSLNIKLKQSNDLIIVYLGAGKASFFANECKELLSK